MTPNTQLKLNTIVIVIIGIMTSATTTTSNGTANNTAKEEQPLSEEEKLDQQQQQLIKDQAEKLQLVLKKIIPYCKEDAPQEEFRKIAKALKEGDQLSGTSLEGSSNYSYKVYLQQSPEEVALFVKVSLSYALWNPTSFYSLERLRTEYQMMKKFSNLLGEELAPVAVPYLCQQLTPDIQMMVARWAPSHEPWASQFIRGNVDRRITPKLAKFVAEINLEQPADINFNDGVKNPMRGLYPIVKAAFGQMIAPEVTDVDHFVQAGRDMGEERFSQVIDALGEHYERQEMLLHGDTHVLNVLVEPLPTSEGGFGSKAEFTMCDWEMTHYGCKGRDPGTFCAFPILVSYYWAASGNPTKAYELLDCTNEFWDHYADYMVQRGKKSPEYMREMFLMLIAWCGVYNFIANFVLRAQWNYMPHDKVSPAADKKVIASVALTGLRFLELGFLNTQPDYSLQELRTWFDNEVKGQIDFLYKCCKDL